MNNIDLITSGNTNMIASSEGAQSASGTGNNGFLAELQAILSTLAGGAKMVLNEEKNAYGSGVNIEPAALNTNAENNSRIIQKIPTGAVDGTKTFPWILSAENNVRTTQKMPLTTSPGADIPPQIIPADQKSGTEKMAIAGLQPIAAVLGKTMNQTESNAQIKNTNTKQQTAPASARTIPFEQTILSDTAPIVAEIKAEIETASVDQAATNLPTGISHKEMTTAEKYIAHFEDTLRAAKEILSMIKQEMGTQKNDRGEKAPETPTAPAPLLQTPSGSAFIEHAMDVMPQKVNPSAAAGEAAELAKTGSSYADAQKPDNVPAPQTTGKQTEAKAAPSPMNAQLADMADEIQVLSGQNAAGTQEKENREKQAQQSKNTTITHDEKSGKRPVEQNQTASAEKSATEKTAPTVFPSEEKNTEGKTLSRAAGQNENTFSYKPKTSAAFESGSKDAVTRTDDTQIHANPKEAASRSAYAPQQEAKHADRILQWESAKDAVNLAKMVQQAGQNGVTKLNVRLTPENLGRLEIQLTEIGGRIDAKIMANSHESRTFLASHGEAIIKQLNERGIHIDNMDFHFHDSLAKHSNGNSHGEKNAESDRRNNSGSKNTNENSGSAEHMESIPKNGLYA